MRIAMVNPAPNPENWGTPEGGKKGWARRSMGEGARTSGAKFPRRNPKSPEDFAEHVQTPYGRTHLSYMSEKLSTMAGTPQQRMIGAGKQWRGIRQRHGSPQPRRKTPYPTSQAQQLAGRRSKARSGAAKTRSRKVKAMAKSNPYKAFSSRRLKELGKSGISGPKAFKQIGKEWRATKGGRSNPGNYWLGPMSAGQKGAHARKHPRTASGRFKSRAGRKSANPRKKARRGRRHARRRSNPILPIVVSNPRRRKARRSTRRHARRRANPATANPRRRRRTPGRNRYGRFVSGRKAAANPRRRKARRSTRRHARRRSNPNGLSFPSISGLKYPTDAPFGDLSIRNFRSNFPTLEEMKEKPLQTLVGGVNGVLWAGTVGGLTRVMTLNQSPVIQEVASIGGTIVGTEVGAWVVPKVMDYAKLDGSMHVKKATRLTGYVFTAISAAFGIIRLVTAQTATTGEEKPAANGIKIPLTDMVKGGVEKLKSYWSAGLKGIGYEAKAVPPTFVQADYDDAGRPIRADEYDDGGVGTDLSQRIMQLKKELGLSDDDLLRISADLGYDSEQGSFLGDRGVGSLPGFIDDDDRKNFVW